METAPRGQITTATTLVLTNAVYFNAAWQRPFEPSGTHDGTFTRLDGTSVTVPMMFQNVPHSYGEGDGFQEVELRYEAPELSMLVVLPDAGRFDEIEVSLSASRYAEYESALTEHTVTVTLPKFEYESPFSLNDWLIALGMTDAFEPVTADFSGMDGTRDLYISAVLHKAFIHVNELGTEAAAATAVIVDRVSVPEPAEITVDRPFLFFIVDHPTGEVLFIGRVLDPSP